MKKLFFISLFVSLASQCIQAQTPEILTIRKFREQNANNIVSEFVKFLSIPDLAKDSTNLLKNANFIMDMIHERGIQNLQLLKGTTNEMPPVVYGEVKVPGAKQTFVFYAHYDGQPVNPTQWAKELAPFDPKLFTDAIDHGGTNIPLPNNNNYNPAWRIYARAASDDKAGVDVILNAFSALKNIGTRPSVNLKFFFEGEEEAGSPHLNEVLEKYSNLLQSDLWIICDGPVYQTGQKQIVFGARGDTHLDLTIYASKRPLHSGHYGNWAPNPAMMMAKLLASMKDESGRVTVKGFYDDVTPLTDAEQKAVREIPSVDEQMKNELGIISTDMKGVSLTEAIMLPSLNINGIQSGNVGKLASNQIPTYATADIDLRLVPGNDWQRQQQKVIDHIKAQGYYVIDHEPSDDERK
ncbi:MAG TPA: M20/M25/M40 family metallo-hydrolase, partial [Puia sp.]|nr:M20/M25/M40 family metallo-hydrolase [Puia sp.]